MRSRFINRYAFELVRRFGSNFSTDFEKNKVVIKQMEPNMGKSQRNELAGYIARILSGQAFEG